MTDPAPWRSPLAGLGRDRFETPGGAVLLEDRSELAKIVLHGKPEDQAFLASLEGRRVAVSRLERDRHRRLVDALDRHGL